MTGRVRKRVTQACQPCGYKKIKCDGVYPECGPCRNKETCSYGTTKRKVNRTSIAGSPGSAASPEDRDRNGPTSAARIASKPAKFQQGTQRVLLALSVTAQMSSYLFQTYFDCIHPLWPLLYKPMYSSLDYTRPNPLLPPVLVSAMFSIAACVQERPHSLDSNADNETRANDGCPEPKLLFEEALVLLQEDDEGGTPHPLHALKPSITNCQVLIILAIQQHGVAEYSRGAMLCALAAAMAIELRLHRAHETTDPIEIEVRSRLWWNLFIAEKMISCEMGRPVILRSEETDAPYPSVSEADEFELMPAQRNTHSMHHRNAPVKLRTLSVLHTSIQLAVIMERISREIYSLSARKAIREDHAAGEKIRMELWLLIRDWERDMEASPLKLDLHDNLSTVPGSITNYVIIWSATILLHRPFIERWQSNPSSCYPTSAISPFEICMQAANNICVVLEKYADCLAGLPCDTIFAIFTAASTFLYNLKQNPSDDETRRRLKLCIHWLSILGRSWKSAGARHQLLADLFDLPKELNSPTGLSADPLPPSEVTPTPSYQFSSTMIPLSPNMDFQQGTGFQTPMEDWAFLRDFGDSTDDFYTLDVQLRGLLDGDLNVRGANNGFR